MTVYELRKELEKWPPSHRIIFCVGTGEPDSYRNNHWFEELQSSDLGAGQEPGTLVLAR